MIDKASQFFGKLFCALSIALAVPRAIRSSFWLMHFSRTQRRGTLARVRVVLCTIQFDSASRRKMYRISAASAETGDHGRDQLVWSLINWPMTATTPGASLFGSKHSKHHAPHGPIQNL